MNTSPEAHRLRYLAPEQLGRDAGPEKGRRVVPPILLLPTEAARGADTETAVAAETIAALEKRLADRERELALEIERSRIGGEQAGRGKAAAEFGQALAESRRELAVSLENFAGERRQYFRRVEGEVVKLALAIAGKILQREAQMDSALLVGIVRAALDRLEETTSAVLRVPPADAGEWRNALGNLDRPPKLVEDAGIRRGGCALESRMGTTDLSLDGQLKEIERGFFDLLREPSPRAAGAKRRAEAARRPNAVV